MFEVEDGQTQEVQKHSGSLRSDYLEIPGADFSAAPASDSRQVSPTGYMYVVFPK